MPWGHNPENFVGKFDWLRDLGKDVAQIPIAIQAQQDLNEGKVQNGDIYQGLTTIASGVDDDEFERSYGMKKDTFLKYAKPGKNEAPEMYMARAFKLTEKGNAALAGKRGYDSFIQELTDKQQGITGVAEQDKAGATAEGMSAEDIQAIGSVPKQPGAAPAQPLKPNEVQSIGNKYGVTTEQMAPQVKTAEQAQTTQQMGALNKDMTRIQGYQAAGGEVTPTTEKAIASLPTEKNMMDDERFREAAQLRLLAQQERLKIDKWKTSLYQRKLSDDEYREIKDSKVKALTAKKNLEIKLKAIEAGVEKSNKNMMGELDQESVKKYLSSLTEINSGLSEYDDNIEEYDLLLKSKGWKGDEAPTKKPKPTAKKNDPLGIR